ncbi:MAG TPA: aldehyde dehydrogenase family protein [Pyrinomonadaceae bacterium]|nr:aldehyde dehydrogenase family protein [Pyrinomonadaceae bacterium]
MNVQPLNNQFQDKKEIISYDPATGEEVGRAPQSTPGEVKEAVTCARLAQAAWAAMTYKERGRVILKAREIMLAERHELALLIARETGKPVAEALAMEVVPTLAAMHYFARKTRRLLQPQRINIGQYAFMGRSSTIVYKPIGVVGIISPWNFPLATPAHEVVMALMAGNSVVVKPSELTPLTALKLEEILKRAGLPQDLLKVIIGDGTTGAELIDAPVDKIMFTGSVATGKRVAEAAAKHLTPAVLELGGKDPMIVLADAHLENAARAAVWGAFSNSGQACASVERCYVDESVVGPFLELVLRETRALRQDSPTKEHTDIGAMSNERQLQIVEEHVKQALEQGAHALTGGKRDGRNSLFYQPTILTKVDHRMTVMKEETFGPVLPVMTFKTEAEAIKLANESPFGLTAMVWTRDIERGRRIAEKIDAGTVMVNEVLYTHGIAETPWGGVKESGYGRTHGRMGMLELVTPQHIHVNRFSFFPDIWWYRYSTHATKLFDSLAIHFTTGSIMRTARLLPQVIRRLFDLRKDTKI